MLLPFYIEKKHMVLVNQLRVYFSKLTYILKYVCVQDRNKNNGFNN